MKTLGAVALVALLVVLAPQNSIGEPGDQPCSVHWVLAAIEARDAAADADAAIRRGSPQFIGVYGLALSSPGVEADPYCLQDTGLLSVLSDTGDDLRCEAHARLQTVARSYALAYNGRLQSKEALAMPPKCLSK